MPPRTEVAFEETKRSKSASKRKASQSTDRAKSSTKSPAKVLKKAAKNEESKSDKKSGAGNRFTSFLISNFSDPKKCYH